MIRSGAINSVFNYVYCAMDITEYSYVVVGSGLLGSVVAERIASQLRQPVLVIEKRDHIGGNCYSTVDQSTGIEYHQYGTHIFHTSNEKVWNYIRRFTTFNAYRHKVLSVHKGQVYPFPINLATLNQFFGKNLKPYEVEDFMLTQRLPSAAPANFEEQALAQLGPQLYEAFFKH